MILKKANKFLTRIGLKYVSFDETPNGYEDEAGAEIDSIRESLRNYAISKPDTLYGNDPERLVRYYNRGRILSYFDVFELLDKHSVEINNKKIADIGSFLPVYMKILCDKYKPTKCHAYELNENVIEISPYYAKNIDLFKCNYFEEKIEEYDVIFCMQVLEHQIDPVGSFKAILDGLVRGGIAMFTVPDGRKDNVDAGNLSDNAMSYSGHINFWSPESWFYYVKSCTDENKFKMCVNEYEFNNNYAIIKRVA